MKMQITSGAYVDPFCPDMRYVTLDDIAVPMSRINRYNGHGRVAWNLVQHSALVADLCDDPMTKVYALLHDAHEVFLGDITTPAARSLESIGMSRAGLREVKKGIDRQIFSGFGLIALDEDHEISVAVHEADILALRIERAMIFPDADVHHPDWPPPLPLTEDHARAFAIAERVGPDGFARMLVSSVQEKMES